MNVAWSAQEQLARTACQSNADTGERCCSAPIQAARDILRISAQSGARLSCELPDLVIRVTRILTGCALGLAAFSLAQAQDLSQSLYKALVSEVASGEEVAILGSAMSISAWDVTAEPDALARIVLGFNRRVLPDQKTGFLENTSVSDAVVAVAGKTKWGRKEFDADEAADYKRTRQLLFEEAPPTSGKYQRTVGYQKYLDLLAAYDALKREFDATPPEQRTAEMKAKLAAARSRLVNEGQQPVYRSAETRLRQLLAYDYSRSVLPSIGAMIGAMYDSQGSPRISVVPAIGSRMPFAQWKTLSLFWPVGQGPGQTADAGGSANKEVIRAVYGNGQVVDIALPPDIKVSADISQLRIVRPWLDLDLLARSAGKWKWTDENQPPLADGPGAEKPLTGLLTFVPTRLFFARGLALEGAWTEQTERALASAVAAGATIRLGPLVLFDPSSRIAMRPFFRSASLLFVPEAQVVGLGIVRPPKLPGPVLNGVIFDSPLPSFPFP